MAERFPIGFPCPGCGDRNTRCLSTRGTAAGITRRRECHGCARRFTTHEDINSAASRLIAAVVRDLAKVSPDAP